MTVANLEQYLDAVAYDAEHSDVEPDGPFYLKLAREVGGPVLELGCGTGRLTIPIAREGIDIVGLDVMPQMLAQARTRARGLPIRWVEADVRAFQLGAKFDLVFTAGFLFHHLLKRRDQEAMLARVREHLTSKGRFLIDVWFIPPWSMIDSREEREWSARNYTDEKGHWVTVSAEESFDALRQIWYLTVYRRWCAADGEQQVRRLELAYRYVFPQEMEALLHYNGFRVLRRYGDWGRSPVTERSETHAYLCAKR